MKITAEFNDLEEMKMFIRNFEGGEKMPSNVQPVAPTVPITPVQPVVPAQAPVQPAVPVTQPVVPTTATSYSIDDLSRAAVALMDAGKQPELLSLLQEFGVEAIPQLPKERYGAFATALREKGAQI